MADTAAFFAKKKKGGKKKTFKSFNANKIDVSSVSSSVHVDAPSISTEGADLSGIGPAGISNDVNTSVNAGTTTDIDVVDAAAPSKAVVGGEQWDDEALAATLARPVAGAVLGSGASGGTGGGATELLDMKTLETKRNEQDDIAERLRVEETRAALAAAREGMEREAQRLKEEKEAKEKAQQEAAIGKPRFGFTASAMGGGGGSLSSGGGGKWVPPHLRGAPPPSRLGSSGPSPGLGFQKKVNTEDENMFPDLASAEAIIQQQQQQQQQHKAALSKKTKPGTSAWGPKSQPKMKTSQGQVAPSEMQSSRNTAEISDVKTFVDDNFTEKKSVPVATKTTEEKVDPAKVAPTEEIAPKKVEEKPTETKPEPSASETKEDAEKKPASQPSANPSTAVKKKKKKKKDLSTFKPSS